MAPFEHQPDEIPAVERFSDRAEDYARFRPSYPGELVKELIRRTERGRIGPPVVADIGAGTGIFSRLMAPLCARLYAVEPNAAMRTILAEATRAEPSGAEQIISVVDGTAEDTMLAPSSVDIVVCAQAFHWFDVAAAQREFLRILRPPAWVGLVWNERRVTGSPFLEGYEALLNRHCPGYPAISHRHGDVERMDSLFGSGRYQKLTWDYVQKLDSQALRGRLFSSSYVPKSAAEPSHALSLELSDLFDRCQAGGRIEMRYASTLYLGHLT